MSEVVTIRLKDTAAQTSRRAAPTGTPDGTKFLRDDGAWATPSGGPGGEAFPVGSVFVSVVSTNPATLLGYGTWAAIGAGRVPVGLDAGDPDFDLEKETGGAKTVASAGTNAAESAHTHSVTSNVAVGAHTPTQPTIAWPAGVPTAANESSHTHTYTQVLNHVHTLATGTGATGNFSQVIGTVDTSSGGTGATPTQTALGTRSGNPVGSAGATGTTSAGSAHSHTLSWPAGVPTASGGGVDAHAVTNNAVTSGAGSSHNHAFTGSATSVIQPYFVVRFWERTA